MSQIKVSQGFSLQRLLCLVCRWPSSPCVLTWSSFCACVLISSFQDTSEIGLGPTLMFYFSYLNYLKTPSLLRSEVPAVSTLT